MSCDEFYHRYFHKKITHTHAHSDDMHHHHIHPKGLTDHHHEAASADDSDHLHEHTHEAAKHEHLSEHDVLYPSDEMGLFSKEKKLSNQKKTHRIPDREPIQTEEK